jgi:hypothetical protein
MQRKVNLTGYSKRNNHGCNRENEKQFVPLLRQYIIGRYFLIVVPVEKIEFV